MDTGHHQILQKLLSVARRGLIMVSKPSTTLYETSPVITVERKKTEKQGSKRSRIHAFFKRAWKTIMKPFLFCRQIRVDNSKLEPYFDSNSEPNNGSLTNLYSLGKELGCGAFSVVYRALRISDGKEVAIKRICKRAFTHYVTIPGCSRPLLNEVAFMLLLRRPPLSPYVIEMFEWFDKPDFFALVMEYPQPCKDLLDFININEHLNEDVARCLMRQLVLALQNCLDHGIVHSDLHAGNMLVNTRTLELKLIDFGCAYQVSRDEHDSSVTHLLSNLGLLLYFMLKGNLDDQGEVSCTSLIPSFSPECCDLMKNYLELDSEWKTLEEILQHQWFKHQSTKGIPALTEGR